MNDDFWSRLWWGLVAVAMNLALWPWILYLGYLAVLAR